jgi:hypothetical protein
VGEELERGIEDTLALGSLLIVSVKGMTIGDFSRICIDFVHKLTSQS